VSVRTRASCRQVRAEPDLVMGKENSSEKELFSVYWVVKRKMVLSRTKCCFPSALCEESCSQSLEREVVYSSVSQDGFHAQAWSFTVSI